MPHIIYSFQQKDKQEDKGRNSAVDVALTAVARTSASARLLCSAAFQMSRSGATCSVTGVVGGSGSWSSGVGGGWGGQYWVGRDFQIALNVDKWML